MMLASTAPSAGGAPPPADRRYHVIALQVPIVFNFDGDHDHNGMIFTLAQNRPGPAGLDALVQDLRTNPASPWHTTPHPLVRPLVLRARVGETVEIRFENHIRGRRVGIHLVADQYNVTSSDGAHVGTNSPSLAGPLDGPPGGNTRTYRWRCAHEGVFPFHDAGDLSGGEGAPTSTGSSARWWSSRPRPPGPTR